MECNDLTLDSFIGQEALKKKISIAIKSANKRNKNIPHILLMSDKRGGMGKTKIASLIAKARGKKLKDFVASAVKSPSDILSILLKAEENDVFFLDEIHALSQRVQECLYTALENFRITINVNNEVISYDVKPFTLIGATTEPGKLTQPIKARFPIRHKLKDYTNDEIQKIIDLYAKKEKITISNDCYPLLIRLSRGIPRAAKNWVVMLRDWCVVNGGSNISLENIKEIAKLNQYHETGLSFQDLDYLKIIYKNFGLGAVGLSSVCAITSEDKEHIESEIEPWLVSNGFLLKTKRGRQLTQAAVKLILS
jgi:Holliday junction DNA helicase RuvB